MTFFGQTWPSQVVGRRFNRWFQEAPRIALLVAPLMKFFYYVFVPGIIVFNGTANYFTRLAGVSPASESEETHTEEEIRMILTRSEETGTYTRYLVLDEDGEPLGFVHAKDILRASETETDSGDSITARELARAVLTVPETRRIDAILADFQTRGEGQMAVVVDEWGVFEGLVTIEDILEEIVGGIQDEFDTGAQEPSIEKRDDGQFDAVYSVETLQHLHPDAEWVFEEVARITDNVLVTVENEGPTHESSPSDAEVNYVDNDTPLYYRDWSHIFTSLGLAEVNAVHGDRDTTRTFRAPG